MRTAVALTAAALTTLTLFAAPAQADYQHYLEDFPNNLPDVPDVYVESPVKVPLYFRIYAMSVWALCYGTTFAGNNLYDVTGGNYFVFVGEKEDRPYAGATQHGQDACPTK